jgi:PAS domain S-box-containing protein
LQYIFNLFPEYEDIMQKDATEHNRLSAILNMLPGFIFVQDGDHNIEFCNQEFVNLFGEPKGRKCYEILQNVTAPCDPCTVTRVLETESYHAFRWQGPNGRVFMFYHNPFEDNDGEFKVLGTGINVSSQVVARKALKKSEGRYRNLYERAPVMLHAMDTKGSMVYVSDMWLERLGYTRERVIGRNIREFLLDESEGLQTDNMLSELFRTGVCKDVHYRYRTKSGPPMDVFVSAANEMESPGAGDGPLIFAVSNDVTERLKAEKSLRRVYEDLENQVQKRTEAYLRSAEKLRLEIDERKLTEDALRRSEKKYSTLVENSLTGIYIKQEGKIVFANERFCDIHGYAPREMVGMESWRLVHPSDRANVEDYSLKRLQGLSAPDQYEARGLTRDHRVIWVVRNNTRILYKGQPAILGNLVDITPRKRVESHLRKSEKELRMLSTQLLTVQENERKRIALELHDTIAQSLVTIKFTLAQKLKQMDRPPDPEGITIESVIDLVQANITEVRRLMTALRPSLLDDLGILATINWHCREFQSVYRYIDIEKDLTISEEEVPHDLKIVIFRILQEAMYNVAKHSEASLIQLMLTMEDGALELTVKDNGKGFDYQGVLSDVSNNKGLGLIGMRERAEQSFGAFYLESRKNEGTRIRAVWYLE